MKTRRKFGIPLLYRILILNMLTFPIKAGSANGDVGTRREHSNARYKLILTFTSLTESLTLTFVFYFLISVIKKNKPVFVYSAYIFNVAINIFSSIFGSVVYVTVYNICASLNPENIIVFLKKKPAWNNFSPHTSFIREKVLYSKSFKLGKSFDVYFIKVYRSLIKTTSSTYIILTLILYLYLIFYLPEKSFELFTMENIFHRFLLFVSIFHVLMVLLLCYIPDPLKSVNNLFFPVLSGLYFGFHHFERTQNGLSKREMIKNIRHYLPEGRYWMDNRKNSVFWSLHGGINAYCSYNDDPDKCNSINLRKSTAKVSQKDLPNIVMFMIESFCTLPSLIDSEFLDEHVHKRTLYNSVVTDKFLHNRNVFKGLSGYSDQLITYSGVRSLGMPTINGLISVLLSIHPIQTGYNIISAPLKHFFDLGSYFRMHNYETIFATPAPVNLDSKQNLVFQKTAHEEAVSRMKCAGYYGVYEHDKTQLALHPESMRTLKKKCNIKLVKKLEAILERNHVNKPRAFDMILDYTPTAKVASALNISSDEIYPSWLVNSRTQKAILSTHWKQIREVRGPDKRIFLIASTGDSHRPLFMKTDVDKYDIPFNRSENPDYDTALFMKLLKQTDQQLITPMIEFLKENDPNTLVIITGDHGNPFQLTPNTDDKTIKVPQYVHEFNHDNFFETSASLLYLGDNEKVKEVLNYDLLRGKTLKIPSSHFDLTYTIFDILARLNGTEVPPLSTRSRNMIDIFKKLVSTNGDEKNLSILLDQIDRSNWHSLSFTNTFIEFSNGLRTLKTSPLYPKLGIYYNFTSFPLSVAPKDVEFEPNVSVLSDTKEHLKYFFNVYNVENYLLYHNTLYHYDFITNNRQCIENYSCTWPRPHISPFSYKYWSFRISHLLLIVVPTTVLMTIIRDAFATDADSNHRMKLCELKELLEYRYHQYIKQEFYPINDAERESSFI